MKIILAGGYYITNDNYNIILNRKRIGTAKKDKKKIEIDEVVGYYGTMRQTIETYLKHFAVDVAKDEIMDYAIITEKLEKVLDKKVNELVTYIERN